MPARTCGEDNMLYIGGTVLNQYHLWCWRRMRQEKEIDRSKDRRKERERAEERREPDRVVCWEQETW